MLFSPVQLLILLLSDYDYQWSFTLLFIPMLAMSLLIIPFTTRKKVEPLATSLVVISNAYTFAQALFLLAVRRPLGWEATGAKTTKKKSQHFTAFKIASLSFFIVVYLATLAVLIINQRIGINPSTFIVSLFIVAFISHIVYLHHTLLNDVKLKRVHVSRHFYAYLGVILLTLSTGVGSYVTSSAYHVRASSSGLTLVAVVPKETSVEPVSEMEVIEEVPVAKVFQPIKVVAQSGDSQHKLAIETVRQIREHRWMDQATAGKLQDKVMHYMGYQSQIVTGSTYVFDEAAVDNLMLNAYVYDYEQAYWSSYAGSIGIL
jgi:hypothetical protein